MRSVLRKVPRLLWGVLVGSMLVSSGSGVMAEECAKRRAARLKPARPALLRGDCMTLAGRLEGLPDTSVLSVTLATRGTLEVAGEAVDDHCVVLGEMHERVSPVDGNRYAVGFEMRLPLHWNGRFFYQANGGIDGNVVTATGSAGAMAKTHPLHEGFAVLSSDAGHTAALGAAFGLDPQARLDYGYQAAQVLTPMAKELVRRAYGKGPDRSYFGGCSNGGRHTFVAMKRLAEEYDGFLAGAPGFRLPLAAIANIAGAQRYSSVATVPGDLSTAFTAAERKLVAEAVLARCDELDGLADGLVMDFVACQNAFSLFRDVPSCEGARDGTCLSDDQKSAIDPIFRGIPTGAGEVFYASFPYDAGLSGAGIGFWEFTAPLVLDSGGVGLIWSSPPEDPTEFVPPVYALTTPVDAMLAAIEVTDERYSESGLEFMLPPSPAELDTLAQRGAKVMVYHGVSDPIFSVADTARWYEEVDAHHGGDASSFVRFYPVPGMGHCSGGPATDQFNMLAPLVAWVEHGKKPRHILAKVRGEESLLGANADVPVGWSSERVRPLCPYPTVARYIGGGDSEGGQRFRCR